MSTIYDVADRAGVSIATVSFAYNKPHLVKAATLDRVLQAALELDYRPNRFARGLAGGKTQLAGLLVPDIRFPFAANVVRTAEITFSDAGFLPIIASTNGVAENTIRLIDQLREQGVDGFILVPSYFGLTDSVIEAIKNVTQESVPLVVAGPEIDDPEIEFVSIQSQAASKRAVNHLVELGHRDIAYVGARFTEGLLVSRFLGYQESLLSKGIPLRPDLVKETDMTSASTRATMESLLDLPQAPTAVFAMNDIIALAIVDVCRGRNIRIPEDLSIVSFDYETFAQRITPQISSVVISSHQVGQMAVQFLLNRYRNPKQAIQQITVPHQFEVRQSTMAFVP